MKSSKKYVKVPGFSAITIYEYDGRKEHSFTIHNAVSREQARSFCKATRENFKKSGTKIKVTCTVAKDIEIKFR